MKGREGEREEGIREEVGKTKKKERVRKKGRVEIEREGNEGRGW